MKFRTHIDGPVDCTGTGLQSTIQATLLELTAVFGRPRAGADGSFFEWHIRFEDGTVCTIYDWRRLEQPEPREVMAWHIGARRYIDAAYVHEAFRNELRDLREAA
jgi:hypothetical protein